MRPVAHAGSIDGGAIGRRRRDLHRPDVHVVPPPIWGWFALKWLARVPAARGRQRTLRPFAQGFAVGALLAMVADTMLPEAYETEQGFTGSLVAVGFAVSLILSSL